MVSGHRVTLTYNLYFDDDNGREPTPAGGFISEPATSVPAQVMASEQDLRSAFQALLENPQFLFGWRYARLWAATIISAQGRSRARARLRSIQGERRNRVSSHPCAWVVEDYGKTLSLLRLVHWVTPVTTFNRQSSAYVACGNESSLGLAYGDVCLIVRIGKAGDRLSYPTVALLKEEWEEKKRHKMRWYRF